jgi:hypothetical protein
MHGMDQLQPVAGDLEGVSTLPHYNSNALNLLHVGKLTNCLHSKDVPSFATRSFPLGPRCGSNPLINAWLPFVISDAVAFRATLLPCVIDLESQPTESEFCSWELSGRSIKYLRRKSARRTGDLLRPDYWCCVKSSSGRDEQSPYCKSSSY